MKILTLNCGSSSVKYSFWEMPGAIPLCQGIVERVTVGGSTIKHKVAGADEVLIQHECPTHTEAIHLIFDYLTSIEDGVIRDLSEVDVVAHRIVH